jgi:hypothetical protein
MARRCICSRLLAYVKDDPRLRTLPMAARMLWVLLAEAMARPGFDGSLPFSDSRRVSLLVSEAQTEVETHLETLIGEGLILREGDSLVCPVLREAAARTIAARRNGAAGGRPRKGETLEEARLRRSQGEMLMPLPKPRETQSWETPSAGVSPRTTTTSTEETTTQSGAWQKLAQDAIRVAGLQLKRPDWTVAQAWLATGLTADAILAMIGDMAARASFDAAKVTSLRYFTPAILRQAGGTEAADPSGISLRPHGDSPLALAIRAWEERGHQGPCPTLQSLRAA